MLERPNIILLSLDEVRSDHLGCYGYERIRTAAFDRIAEEGTLFENCISSSELTCIAMAAVVTGRHPSRNGMRDPYSQVAAASLATILHDAGYQTAGFVGNGILSAEHGFSTGFDHWDECSEEKSWASAAYKLSTNKRRFFEGNYWIEEFFSWLEAHRDGPFLMWGHYFETHEGSEHYLLEQGHIEEGKLPEFGYYDAKIAMVDDVLIARLLDMLDRLGIASNTYVVVMADHGTNLGDHAVTDLPWRERGTKYPQHTTMYDHDLRVPVVVRGPGIPESQRVQGVVASIDIAPTLCELAKVSLTGIEFDGVSLVPAMAAGVSEGRRAYSEDLFEARGDGALQAITTDQLKYMRNLTRWTEEYYDIRTDPEETRNTVSALTPDVLVELRKELNGFLQGEKGAPQLPSGVDKERVDERLRDLGYIH